jgi:hypothetical protein
MTTQRRDIFFTATAISRELGLACGRVGIAGKYDDKCYTLQVKLLIDSSKTIP